MTDDARQWLALPNDNTAQYLEIKKLEAGQTLYVGDVASQARDLDTFGEYATGGGLQIWVLDNTSYKPVSSGPNP